VCVCECLCVCVYVSVCVCVCVRERERVRVRVRVRVHMCVCMQVCHLQVNYKLVSFQSTISQINLNLFPLLIISIVSMLQHQALHG
jgi:NADH:ubiquinone oxidoreductase subunit K